MNRAQRIIAAGAAALLAFGGLAACTGGPEHTLRVLAGSEVEDMAPILDDLEKATGVRLEFEYMGTLDGTEALVGGADPAWDATWFPSNRYLSLFPEGQELIDEATSIMRSPVVLGIKPEASAALGWSSDAPPSWQDVVSAIEADELSYGMTSPVASNSGFTTLVQAATALAGTGTVLTEDDIDAVTPLLEGFASGQSLVSGSSGWLAERFAEDPGAADAVFNYESVLTGLELGLDILAPSDGSITSDYPLTLLTTAEAEAAEAYDAAVDYLMDDVVQKRISDLTHRRTNATAPADAATSFELPFPAQLQTVQQLLRTWVSTARKPAQMVFAIDTSGSMSQGERMDDLHEALRVLSGEPATDSGGFLTLQPRERITYLEFADVTKSQITADIPVDPSGYAAAMDEINDRVDRYHPGGGTAIYDAVETALRQTVPEAGDDSISSVVLFSDGANGSGADLDDFTAWYEDFVEASPEAARVPVHAIVFAEADAEEMRALTELTGGRTFIAAEASLASVFREIRGYL
ncbi:VWA domain-containing protein [Microbacterium nanhaiense]|uniref:VWA domain-containing protein n=1 Tax=Microbacterium nanhaiense TaxID=1301026 RepID=A0ABQ2N4I2_9MICO|nr:substrate-binding domain-containing protein [Microbacterium nanhaiense]GGO66901.1 VWA domain-containing protein [Microbacterium nanhaiense]